MKYLRGRKPFTNELEYWREISFEEYSLNRNDEDNYQIIFDQDLGKGACYMRISDEEGRRYFGD